MARHRDAVLDRLDLGRRNIGDHDAVAEIAGQAFQPDRIGAKLRQPLIRAAGQSDDLEQISGLGPHPFVVEGAETMRRHVADEDIFENRQVRK